MTMLSCPLTDRRVLHTPADRRCRLQATASGATTPATATPTAATSGGDEGSESVAERGRVRFRQIQLVLAAVQAEGHRLRRHRAVDIIDTLHLHLPCHVNFRSVPLVDSWPGLSSA